MLSPEELLQKRYRIIAEDTSGNLKVGQVLVHDEEANAFWCGKTSFTEEQLKLWPHLFCPLAWWEERKPEDMPEYVKCEGRVAKARFDLNETSAFFMYLDDEIIPYSPDQFKPATSEEYALYLTYKNKNNG